MEFYFSDSNLPRDKFLKKSIEESDDRCILSIFCFRLFTLRYDFMALDETRTELEKRDWYFFVFSFLFSGMVVIDNEAYFFNFYLYIQTETRFFFLTKN